MKNKIFVVCCVLTALLAVVIVLLLRGNKNSYSDYTDNADLSQYFDAVINTDKVVDCENFTESVVADRAISSLMTDNGFANVEVLESWYDYGIERTCFYVLFDESRLYLISINGVDALVNEHDYNYYLEMNDEEE